MQDVQHRVGLYQEVDHRKPYDLWQGLKVIAKLQQSQPHDDQAQPPIKRQRILQTTLKCTSTDHAHQKIEVCLEWIHLCITVIIPLSKTDHPQIRAFLQKHVKNGGAIPSAKVLQDTYLQDVYLVERDKL